MSRLIAPPGISQCQTGNEIPIGTIVPWVLCSPAELPNLRLTGPLIGSSYYIDQEQEDGTFLRIADPPRLGFQCGYTGLNGFIVISDKNNTLVLQNETQKITYTIIYASVGGPVIKIFAEKLDQVKGSSVNNTITQSSSLNSNIMIQPNSIKFNTEEMIRIPAITMTLQSDIRGDNLIEAAFNIYDRIAYCSDYPSGCDNDNNRCVNTVANKRTRICPTVEIATNKLIETKYSRQPFNFNKVVKGQGCTLRQKLESINDTGLDIDEFMARVCIFGMIKYILGRMITGQFRLKWLLKRNEEELFQRLNRSRLCEFREAFELPEIRGYSKYFR